MLPADSLYSHTRHTHDLGDWRLWTHCLDTCKKVIKNWFFGPSEKSQLTRNHMKFANHYSHISQSSWYSFQNILKGWIFGIVILKQSKWETNTPKLSYFSETWICFYTFANIKFVELFDAFDFFLVTTTHFLATTIIISDVWKLRNI